MSLQVETSCKDNVPLYSSAGFAELPLQIVVTDSFSCQYHLSEKLLKTPHNSDDAALKDRGHLADVIELSSLERMLGELISTGHNLIQYLHLKKLF